MSGVTAQTKSYMWVPSLTEALTKSKSTLDRETERKRERSEEDGLQYYTDKQHGSVLESTDTVFICVVCCGLQQILSD